MKDAPFQRPDDTRPVPAGSLAPPHSPNSDPVAAAAELVEAVAYASTLTILTGAAPPYGSAVDRAQDDAAGAVGAAREHLAAALDLPTTVLFVAAEVGRERARAVAAAAARCPVSALIDPDPRLGGLDEDYARAAAMVDDEDLPAFDRRRAWVYARALRHAVLVLTDQELPALPSVDRQSANG